jgi:hypothetical protein
MAQQHPMILDVNGLSTWNDIGLTKSLYDLTNFGGYNFEEAKGKVNALAMRRWLNKVRNAWTEKSSVITGAAADILDAITPAGNDTSVEEQPEITEPDIELTAGSFNKVSIRDLDLKGKRVVCG